MGPAAVLARLAAALCRLADNLALDVVEPADPLQRVLGNRRRGRFPDVVEIAPKVRPAGRLAGIRGSASGAVA